MITYIYINWILTFQLLFPFSSSQSLNSLMQRTTPNPNQFSEAFWGTGSRPGRAGQLLWWKGRRLWLTGRVTVVSARPPVSVRAVPSVRHSGHRPDLDFRLSGNIIWRPVAGQMALESCRPWVPHRHRLLTCDLDWRTFLLFTASPWFVRGRILIWFVWYYK